MTTQSPPPGQSGPSLVGALFEMWNEIQLAWRLFRDDQVPMLLKAVPVLGMIYVISPVDFLPDVIPVLGQMDDIAIIAFAVKTFVDLAPKDRVAFHRTELGHTKADDDKTIDGSYRS